MHPSVVHLVISLSPGGLERLVVDWANGRNREHPGSTAVCCLDAPGELAAQVDGGSAVVLGADRGAFPMDLLAVRRLRRFAAGGGARVVVHSHNLAAQQYAVAACAGTRMRHCHTQHGANLHNRSRVNRLRSRLLCALTHRIVAVSASTARAMAAHQGIPPARIRVVPNGVAPHRPAPAAGLARLRSELSVPGDAFVAGSVGRLAEVKGFDRLLRAWAAVLGSPAADRARGGTARPLVLLLVGDGPERASLEAAARGLGIASSVRFAGFRPDARSLLDLMDLFVLPSRSEGLPVSLLEAMSAGVPVCVTDAGESRDVVADGAAGVLLPDDEALWPEVLRRVIRDIAGAADGAEGGGVRARVALARSRVEGRYSLASTLAALDAIYAGMFGGRDAAA